MAPTKDKERTLASFADMMAGVNHGKVEPELAEALREVVAAVMTHRKAGGLTFQIVVNPEGENAVMIYYDIATKLPRSKKPGSLLYADEDHNLSRRDPRQPDLPMSPSPQRTAPVLQLPDRTGSAQS